MTAISERTGRGQASSGDGDPMAPVPDQPRRISEITREGLAEIALSVAGAICLVGVVFALAGLGTNAWIGFVICWGIAFLINYWSVSVKRHGVLVAKDRLARAWVAAGALVALVCLGWILSYVLVNGWYAAFGHQFPSFWAHDFSKGGVLDVKAKVGALHAIVGTLEQVGLATAATTPIAILAAVYLNEMPGKLAVVLRAVGGLHERDAFGNCWPVCLHHLGGPEEAERVFRSCCRHGYFDNHVANGDPHSGRGPASRPSATAGSGAGPRVSRTPDGPASGVAYGACWLGNRGDPRRCQGYG